MEDFIVITYEHKMENGIIIENVFDEYQTFEEATKRMYSCARNRVLKTSGVLFDVESNEIPYKDTFTNYISATVIANDYVTRLHLPDVKIYRRMWYDHDKKELMSHEYKFTKDNHIEVINEHTNRLNKAFVSGEAVYVQNRQKRIIRKEYQRYNEHVDVVDDNFNLYIVENNEAKSFEEYMNKMNASIKRVTPKMFIDNVYLFSYFFIDEVYKTKDGFDFI